MTWSSGPKRGLPAGLDMYDRPLEPRVEPVDELSRFVLDQIRAQETEPRIDQVPQRHDEPNGALAYRYAGKVRDDCVVFRRIVALYVSALAEVDAAENDLERNAEKDRALGLRQAVAALAARWDDQPAFKAEWRVQ